MLTWSQLLRADHLGIAGFSALDYFRFLGRDALRNRTPSPPPFASMNSMPPVSRARDYGHVRHGNQQFTRSRFLPATFVATPSLADLPNRGRIGFVA
jgi:hypothetical protein